VRYNDVRLCLVEPNAQIRREWITALNTVETLKPRAVIAARLSTYNSVMERDFAEPDEKPPAWISASG
jgi:hypothetical protein